MTRMGHGNALNKLPTSEEERWKAVSSKVLPACISGYMEACEVATQLMHHDVLPHGMETGGEWLRALGSHPYNMLPGGIFVLPSIDAQNLVQYEADMERLVPTMEGLHKAGCKVVPFVHEFKEEAKSDATPSRIKQLGLFLPHVHLVHEPERLAQGIPPQNSYRMERDVEGEATFLSYLREKNLVTEEQIKEMYPNRGTSFIQDAVVSKIETKLGHTLK